MPENWIKNGGFEAAWSEESSHRCLVLSVGGEPREISLGNIATPPGWLTWCRREPGVWETPEVLEVWRQNYPRRVHSGQKAILLSTCYRRHDAGLLQQVRVAPGTRLRLSAWAHAWSNHPLAGYEWCDSRSDCSCGVGEQAAFILEGDAPPPNGDPWSDAIGNVTFSLGLDPTGGTDPFAETVVWGRGAHIYNAYREVPPVEATAQSDRVTVFLRSQTRWPFRNNDAYWDDVELVSVPTPSGRPSAGASPKRAPGDAVMRGEVPPRRPQKSTYVLLPRIADEVERIEWRVAAAIGCADRMWAVGHLDDGAAANPRDREVIAVNPAAWERDLRAWYAEHHLGVEYREIETASPWEMAVMLLPPLEGDIALAQTDRRWARYDFGEHPGAGGGTIGRYGCFMTGLAIILRKIYGRDVTPLVLDKLLVAARAPFVDDNLLMWESAVPLFPVFDDCIKDNRPRSAAELKELLQNGWEVILMRADGGHFVYLEAVEGNTLHIIDTWDAVRKTKAASDYRGIRAARVRRGAAAAAKAQASAGDRHVYVLLPPIADPAERLRWRVAAAIGASGRLGMIGHSVDEAGGRAGEQEVIAVNPGAGTARTSSARYTVIESASPWEAAVRLMPALDGDIALAQSDPRWANADFGEQPGASTETIGRCGSFLTALAITLRRVYGRDVTPPALDELLVAARAAYTEDNLLLWGNAVSLFPAFDDSVKDNHPRSAAELERLLRDGWEIVLRQADGGRFIYLETVEGDVLHVIDPRDGTRKDGRAADYRGIRAAHRKRGPPASTHRILVGLHDRRGGEWMMAQGIRGCCLVHQPLQRHPVEVDCRHLADAGVTVICRLTWGYADGSGTLPRPEDKDAFVNAVVQTMLTARGVEYFCIGNEPNNRQEWPGFGRGNEFALTPQYVVEIYNRIWEQVAGRAKMGPPPVDPYFGPGSNNRDWWRYILRHISGADALFLHAKTQTNDPAEVWSRARFAEEPLTWQYLHLRTVETALAVVPQRFRALPVFVTELNPQYLDGVGGALGWRPDNARWVREALRYFREEQPVAGVVFYRYESSAGDQSPFGLEDKPTILAAIKEEAGA